MMRFTLIFPMFLFIFFSNYISSSSYYYNIPRLSPIPKSPLHKKHHHHHTNSIPFDDFKTYYYNQTLDHFNFAPESYVTFQQRYVVNSRHWGGSSSNSPIFAYLGDEEPLDNFVYFIGFLTDNAPRFRALLVYIEHRFYGESAPYGSMNEAMKSNKTPGYFNSAQALADFAEVLLHVKKQFSCPDSPIIVFGGSYGGMLASWFRLKYPHIALGALASSAPILYFDNITPQNGYDSIVTRDFKEVSMKCYETIRKSWSVIEEIASKHNGLSILSQKFNTCSTLNDSYELTNFLESMYGDAAQFNVPSTNPVAVICRGIVDDDDDDDDDDVLGRIYSGVVASMGNNKMCVNTNYYINPSTETSIGYGWQNCSEMIIPFGRGSNDTMFQASPFNMSEYIHECNTKYGVSPRPHWITTYYGGHDIKLILHRFASNIIFSNGLQDPYSSGGVLENISSSVVAVYTTRGSHCLDIYASQKSDPDWLTRQRNIEIQIIEGWLETYYADLLAFKGPTTTI